MSVPGKMCKVSEEFQRDFYREMEDAVFVLQRENKMNKCWGVILFNTLSRDNRWSLVNRIRIRMSCLLASNAMLCFVSLVIYNQG